ncbi:MAG TPA: cysteine desulfurase family protein [Planctomycetaceae bacterium]|nr:cysteine desulfurase family protein [Planctomycetaceae bacterium]
MPHSSLIYLDCHATTPVDPRVLEAMLPWFTERFGNAASINHAYGREAAEAVEAARQEVADLLNVSPRGIVFTSGATEANNLALKGVLAASRSAHRLVTNAGEHKAVLDPAARLKRRGCDVAVVPIAGDGRVDPQQVADAMTDETVLVSVMAANNEVGAINVVAEIGRFCRQRGVLFHCDAAQAVGKIPFDLGELPIDLVSLSGHKLYAPKGVGVLWVRPGEPRIRLEPLFDGGGHESRLRSGTLPVPLIVGLGAACRLAREERAVEAQRLVALRERLWSGLQSQLEGLTLNGPPVERLPGNLHVSFAGVDGDALLSGLTEVAVSSGSACTSADPEPSHVLQAMGVSEVLSRASLRFGLGRFTTADEIDRAIAHVVEVVTRLRDFRRRGEK